MRKQIRDQLIGLLDSMDEGVKGVRKLGAEDAHDVLVDCYDALLVIEETLERDLSEEGFARYTPQTETLKEALEALNETLGGGEAGMPESKACRTGIKKLRGLLHAEPELRAEWVFLPYNASMWDSMESVWLAAKDKCDCYVIPIPYREMGPDRKPLREVYEGDRFPDYVPVTDYRDYDFDGRRPDAIFIHNPYDEYNYVTSVHPDFYTSVLKPYTDMLAYIPYYANFGAIPEIHAQLPSSKYIDRIFVQSESARKDYLPYVSPHKVVVIGSPKFDKVISSAKNPPPMPAEWARIARGRKLIFYNTTLGALLQHGEEYIEKLKSVIEVFREDPNLVLLWRPHPLNGATVQSMRPGLLLAYQELVRDYRETDAGIYDDSADVHRAMALSAVYYGDKESSLAAMYLVSGKPVVVQDVGIQESGVMSALSFRKLIVDENKILWAICEHFNGVFRLNVDTGEIEEFYKTPRERWNAWPVGCPASFSGKIYWASNAGHFVAAADTATGMIATKQWDSAGPSPRDNVKFLFYAVVNIGSLVILLPRLHKGILIYDTVKQMWKNDTKWLAAMIKLCGKESDTYFQPTFCLDAGRCFLPIAESNAVMEYDPTNGEATFHTIGNTNNRYYRMTRLGSVFWLIPMALDSPVVRWDKDADMITEFRDYPAGLTSQNVPFVAICEYHRDVLLLSSYSNILIRLNPQTGEMTECTDLPMNLESATGFQYHVVERVGDWIYAFADFDKTLYRLHAETGDVQKQQFRLTQKNWNKVLRATAADSMWTADEKPAGHILPEWWALSDLHGFLGALTAGDEPLDFCAENTRRNIAANLDGTAGEKIFEYVMKSFR